MPAIVAVCGLAAVAAGVLVGCPSDARQARPWSAREHSREDGESGDPMVFPPDDDDPIIAARAVYAVQCAACHGERGRGDGPQAAMMRPPDLTNPTLQATRTDEQLRQTILNGRGSMPPFRESIRPSGAGWLVAVIRNFSRATSATGR